MNRILCCTDGSVYAPSIYEHTAWAARRSEASVHVLHMLDAHRERAAMADFSGNIGPDTGQELLEELVQLEEKKNRLAREKGKLLLQEAHKALAAAGVSEVSLQQLHGELVESVTKMEKEVDLVVMGKRGESADFAKLHLGSNLERVIRASIRPVLVASRAFVPIDQFLLAYDGGPSSEKAIDFITSHPLLQGLKAHLLRAGRKEPRAEQQLETAAGRLSKAGFDVQRHFPEGHPEEVISRSMQDLKIPLLVMGAYGHSRIRQLMVGSTTTAMVRTCQVPVLMFR